MSAGTDRENHVNKDSDNKPTTSKEKEPVKFGPDVVHGNSKCQTSQVKWLYIQNLYEKFHRPNTFNIGGTYIDNVPDFWFNFKTERVKNIFLLHLFIMKRGEAPFNISVSSNSTMSLEKKGSVYLTSSLKGFKYPEDTKKVDPGDASQLYSRYEYVNTYEFSDLDVDFIKDKHFFIAASMQEIVDIHEDLSIDVKMKHDCGELLVNPVGSDFTIESEDGEKFSVHKIILTSQCEVFKAMLKDETAESLNNYVKLIDINAEGLRCMLEFMYTGTVKDLNNKDIEGLLMVSDRYNLSGLRELAQHALAQQLCIKNALDLLVVADLYRSEYLKFCALKFIKKYNSCLKSSTYKELSPDLMRELCLYLVNVE